MKISEISSETSGFHINSSYQAFTERQKNVFDQLGAITFHKPNISDDDVQDMDTDQETLNSSISRRQQTKHFSGKESIFKKPMPPHPKNFGRKIPDYQRNPHKWTKYSLGDVSNEDMSDHTNTATAMSFLKELALRKEQNVMQEEQSSERICFKKVIPTQVQQSVNTPIFHLSKIVMPEYVVGQKAKRSSKCKKVGDRKVGLSKQLKLDHLEDHEQDEEFST